MYATIDTLQITKRLQDKGAKPELAEEFAEIMKEREQASFENLATKNDIKEVRSEIKEVRSEIKEVRSEINIAMYKAVIAMGVIVALVEKFIN